MVYAEPMKLSELILLNEDDLDDDSRLVMWEIANYVHDEFEEYSESADDDRAHLIWMLHLLFHSDLAEFTEYFRGYYGTPDNQLHQLNIKASNTSKQLYIFLEGLDWSSIYEACRRESDIESISKIFKDETGFDYIEERERYPVKQWDGSPRWKMVNGMYIAS
jgi:hypothetical protein